MILTKNFVSTKRDVRLYVALEKAQFAEVRKRLVETFPALEALSAAGQCQMISAVGQLRIAPVRGGQLPHEVTTQSVQAIVLDVVYQPQPVAVAPVSDPAVEAYTKRASGFSFDGDFTGYGYGNLRHEPGYEESLPCIQ